MRLAQACVRYTASSAAPGTDAKNAPRLGAGYTIRLTPEGRAKQTTELQQLLLLAAVRLQLGIVHEFEQMSSHLLRTCMKRPRSRGMGVSPMRRPAGRQVAGVQRVTRAFLPAILCRCAGPAAEEPRPGMAALLRRPGHRPTRHRPPAHLRRARAADSMTVFEPFGTPYCLKIEDVLGYLAGRVQEFRKSSIRSAGTAKPALSMSPLRITRPISRPRSLKTGPPLEPGLTAALV